MYREVLILRDAERLTAAEVAEVLGSSVDAVKSRLHRARVSVRQKIAPVLGIGDTAPAAKGLCPDVVVLFSRHLENEINAETVPKWSATWSAVLDADRLAIRSNGPWPCAVRPALPPRCPRRFRRP
jgi:hypothetical protein